MGFFARHVRCMGRPPQPWFAHRPMGSIRIARLLPPGHTDHGGRHFRLFLFQMVFMDTAATIPTGSGAERIRFLGFIFMGFWVSMFIYPLIGNWVWGGGWMADLGRTLGLGNGSVDFAGSGVVHTTGGAIGLACAIVIGPASGALTMTARQCDSGAQHSHRRAGHHHPFFWLVRLQSRLRVGHSGARINLVSLAAVNTLMAGAAGGLAAMCFTCGGLAGQKARSVHVGEWCTGRAGGNYSALRLR